MNQTSPDLSQWDPWIAEVSAAVGVDPARVDVAALHELAGDVSRQFLRPMAPVATYLWGLAVASRPEADPDELRRAILAAMPETKDTREA